MNRTVNIMGQEIVIKEQDGQRVVTFNDIDKVHNRPLYTAQNYFRQNITMFKENKDFIPFKGNKGRVIHLITASGYVIFKKLHLINDKDDVIMREMLSIYFTSLEEREELESMNNLQIFNSQEFGRIRTVMVDNEPWFVGKDVAIALGYAKPENAISSHVSKEDKTSTLIQGSGSNYKSKAIIINESGLYALIFGSKLESAKRFKHWVTSEVLPTLRRTGTYGMNENVEQTVTVTETSSDIYIEASKIVAGCIEGSRPYVLNILRHLIPDIGYDEDTQISESPKKVTEVAVKTEMTPSKPQKTKKYFKQGVDIDISKLLLEMGNQGLSVELLAQRANVSPASISGWIAGEHKPVMQNRINVCVALGKDENFLTPKRRTR